MGSLDNFKNSVMTLVIIALIIGALALALGAFTDDMGVANACPDGQGQWYYNATKQLCCSYFNASHFDCNAGNETAGEALNITREGLAGIGNATSYLSTIGTLLGVAALIAIVIGAFMFVRK